MEHFSAREIQDLFRQEAVCKAKKKTSVLRGNGNKTAIASPTEHQEQVALFQHCKRMEIKYPELRLIFAIPNGGQRHLLVAKKLKAEGVKSGISDIFLPVPKASYHGLFIELKRRKGGSLSKSQKWWIEQLTAQGYYCAVCHGWEEAWGVIEEYIKQACHVLALT